eukprot:tig00021326_g20305.t1
MPPAEAIDMQSYKQARDRVLDSSKSLFDELAELAVAHAQVLPNLANLETVLTKKLDDLSTKLDEAKKEQTVLTKKFDDLSTKLDETKKEQTVLTNKLDDLSTKLDRQDLETKKELGETKKELGETKKEITSRLDGIDRKLRSIDLRGVKLSNAQKGFVGEEAGCQYIVPANAKGEALSDELRLLLRSSAMILALTKDQCQQIIDHFAGDIDIPARPPVPAAPAASPAGSRKRAADAEALAEAAAAAAEAAYVRRLQFAIADFLGILMAPKFLLG